MRLGLLFRTRLMHMDKIESLLQPVLGLGLDSKELNAAQMALRAAVVYAITVLIVRFGKKRFMGEATAFDVILGIMLGRSSAAPSQAMRLSSRRLLPAASWLRCTRSSRPLPSTGTASAQ
jgi:hypothetical protein